MKSREYDTRREFEKWLSLYKERQNGKTEEFMKYIHSLHKMGRLNSPSRNIGVAVVDHIEFRALEHSSPYGFLKYMFHDFPEPKTLKERFRGQIKG